MINPQDLSEGDNIRYCNIPWLHNENMGLLLFLVDDRRDTMVLSGGGGGGEGKGIRPHVKKSMRGSFEI